jgi:hypothetical protein
MLGPGLGGILDRLIETVDGVRALVRVDPRRKAFRPAAAAHVALIERRAQGPNRVPQAGPRKRTVEPPVEALAPVGGKSIVGIQKLDCDSRSFRRTIAAPCWKLVRVVTLIYLL